MSIAIKIISRPMYGWERAWDDMLAIALLSELDFLAFGLMWWVIYICYNVGNLKSIIYAVAQV